MRKKELWACAQSFPFLLEDRLKERGGLYSAGAKLGSLCSSARQACDRSESGLLGPVARELLNLLRSVLK